MAQENALIVLDDQRQEGKTFGRIRNRMELQGEVAVETEPVDHNETEYAKIITEVNYLRRRVKDAEALELHWRRKAQAVQERCSVKLTNIAGICICGAMVFAAAACMGAGTAWLLAIPAAVAVSVSKIAGWW